MTRRRVYVLGMACEQSASPIAPLYRGAIYYKSNVPTI